MNPPVLHTEDPKTAKTFGPVTLRRLIFASFPRSGHHLTVGLLSAYWGANLRYCEPYRTAISAAHNLVKTHDFDLDERYFSPRLVLVRRPMDSLSSFYDWSLKAGHLKTDSYENWILFATSKVRYWRSFYVKWLKESRDEKLVVDYNDLLDDPATILSKIISFQCAGHAVDAERLEAAIETVNPQVKGSYSTFRYFDPKDNQAFNAAAWL